MRNKSSKIFFSIFYPTLFVLLLWGIKIFEIVTRTDLSGYGLYPRTLVGMQGILTAPLLHAGFPEGNEITFAVFRHLFSNTLPLLILGTIIFFFYRPIAFQIFFWIYFMTGVWVWAAARPAYHIGASGIIYGFITFLFFSGVFRKDSRLLALSLFVVFLYGSTIWGILPLQSGTSWESHLLGALAGLITAYHFRKEGPPPRTYDLGSDDENEQVDVSGDQLNQEGDEPHQNINVVYHFQVKKADDLSDSGKVN